MKPLDYKLDSVRTSFITGAVMGNHTEQVDSRANTSEIKTRKDFIEGFERRYPTHVLETLLCDRTTGKNIIWANNEYEALGDGYAGDDEITVEKIFVDGASVIRPRFAKEAERQSLRTKTRAEVFTPSWLCNRMNNDMDEAWFGKRDVFNTEVKDADCVRDWTATPETVVFPKTKGHGWHAYVEATRLEITCGEAPFVCSRYDTVTGRALPVAERVGFLDRKLRVVSENVKTRKEWFKWALAALKATYAFEYQGDNLLIARINVLETFAEHLQERWGEVPTPEETEAAAWVVSWNLWQMNGFTDAVPANKTGAEIESTLGAYEQPEDTAPLCVIYDWKADEPFEFASMKDKTTTVGRKFYAIIGNPPYQMKGDGNKTFAPPIYHKFMDAAYEIGEKVELVTPARFLFNAGSTPKAWNRKMLGDKHLKVELYEADASMVFPNTDIKGGVAVTYRDEKSDFGTIGTFTAFAELGSILKKVISSSAIETMDSIIPGRGAYRLSKTALVELPQIESLQSAGHRHDVGSGAFKILKDVVFFAEKPDDNDGWVRFLGLVANRREFYWCLRKYQSTPSSFDSYKVFLPKANGSGALGETLSTPLVGEPLVGTTESFISIGSFQSRQEAENCMAYVKSKFARTMLGILKITQDNPASKWKYVPLQDFTPASDIDWSKPTPGIDRQLYAKYGLDENEIEFIESHVKEMDSP